MKGKRRKKLFSSNLRIRFLSSFISMKIFVAVVLFCGLFLWVFFFFYFFCFLTVRYSILNLSFLKNPSGFCAMEAHTRLCQPLQKQARAIKWNVFF